jgi:hypothetical protein
MLSSAGISSPRISRQHKLLKRRKIFSSRQGVHIREDLRLQPNGCKNLEFCNTPVNVTHDIWFFTTLRSVKCYCGLLVYDTMWFGKWLTLCHSATCYHVREAPAKVTFPVEQYKFVRMTNGLLVGFEHFTDYVRLLASEEPNRAGGLAYSVHRLARAGCLICFVCQSSGAVAVLETRT